MTTKQPDLTTIKSEFSFLVQPAPWRPTFWLRNSSGEFLRIEFDGTTTTTRNRREATKVWETDGNEWIAKIPGFRLYATGHNRF